MSLRKAKIAGKSRREYNNVINGVAVQLTRAEVVKLRAHRRACATSGRTRSSSSRPPTPRSSSASTGTNGVWQKQFGGDEQRR